jgi:hypothetical protein
VRAGGGAAVGVVAKGVDMHATLGVGVVASDVPGDGGGRRLGLLLEDNGALDGGVTAENAYWTRGEVSLAIKPPRRRVIPGRSSFGFQGIATWPARRVGGPGKRAHNGSKEQAGGDTLIDRWGWIWAGRADLPALTILNVVCWFCGRRYPGG